MARENERNREAEGRMASLRADARAARTADAERLEDEERERLVAEAEEADTARNEVLEGWRRDAEERLKAIGMAREAEESAARSSDGDCAP